MSFSKCNCTACSGHIEFEVAHAGQTIPCPHCGIDTLLFVPGTASPDRTSKKRQIPKFWMGLLFVLIIFASIVGLLLAFRPYIGAFFAGIGIAIPGVIGILILAFVLIWALLWVMFPVFVYTELHKANRTLEKIEANTRRLNGD